MRIRSYVLATTFIAATSVMVTADSDAVGTRKYVMNSLSSFEGGDLEGVAIASNGAVSAGFNLANTPITDATSVWSHVLLKDGSVLLGTASGGKIYQVKNGKVTLAADTETMAVSSMVMSGDSVIAGTFPDGKIFKLSSSDLTGKKLQPWVKLEKTEDVWALAKDPKSNNIYAATGPDGKLFRINDGGKAEVHFDSEEPHLVSVAVGPDGSVYTGSNGEALLYKVDKPGRATVMYDFDNTDVKSIVFDKKGRMYVTSNSYRGGYRGLRPSRFGPPGGGYGGGGGGGGTGQLMRFSADGVAEDMYRNTSGHFVTLALDDKGTPFVGLGSGGKVYSVDDNHITKLEVDTEERQVVGIELAGNNRFIICSDPVVFHSIKGRGGADAVWTSKVLDAGLRAHYGNLEFDADGTLELQTRSGNTKKPDNTWSPWSAAIVKKGKVTSPSSRYLQVRARWSKDPAAVLHEVKVHFVTDNARALITEVTAGYSASNTGSSSVPRSGDKPSGPSTNLSISWRIDNPDNDKMRYRLYYQREGAKKWLAILEPHVEHTSTSYSWDTSGLPEGKYIIRVDATDELSNPPGKVTKHSNKSRAVTIDNTAPVMSNLVLNGQRLQGTATDEIGPITAFEFALVGKKTWYPLSPKDNVFDDKTESFDADVSKHVPSGDHLVVVRAYDEAGNRVERTVGKGK